MVLAIVYAVYLGYANFTPTAHVSEEIVVETQEQNFCYLRNELGHTTVIIVNQTETKTTTYSPYDVITVITKTNYFIANSVTQPAYWKIGTTRTTTESGVNTISCTA